MSLTLSNEYLGLSQGPIDHNASSVINVICGDSDLQIGETVILLPEGTGVGFTQPEDLLPRVGRTKIYGSQIYGVVVGGDFEGIYDDGLISLDSNNIALGLTVAFFGSGVRVCIQGRCLALSDGDTLAPINTGDSLTSSVIGLVLAREGQAVSAIALQPTSQADSIIAIDIQREGKIPGDITELKKELTVLETDVTGPQTDFPLLVSITDTDLRDFARPDGFDIFFTESNGTTVIPYARESYDSSTGTLVAWVLVDLSDTVDNTFFMFFGNPNATDQQNPSPVWTGRFEDVFLFNESNFPWINSSVGKDFTINVETTDSVAVTGQMDTGANSSRDNVIFKMPITTDETPTDFFIYVWAKYDLISTTSSFASYTSYGSASVNDATNKTDVYLLSDPSDKSKINVEFMEDGDEISDDLIGDMSDLKYHQVAVRFLSGTITTFFDGAVVNSFVFSPPEPFRFNGSISGQDSVNATAVAVPELQGRIDQLQVAHTGSFTDGFVATSFDNQKDSGQGAGNFVKVGPLELA